MTPTETALRALHDAVCDAWGDHENCEYCAAMEDSDYAETCQLHGSTPIYQALQAARRALGPCRCGHTVDEHFDEDTTRCRLCECAAFTLPKVAALAPLMADLIQAERRSNALQNMVAHAQLLGLYTDEAESPPVPVAPPAPEHSDVTCCQVRTTHCGHQNCPLPHAPEPTR